MRYSLYKYSKDGIYEYKLFFESQFGNVVGYKFTSDNEKISNEFGVARLFGSKIFDIAGEYMLYPVQHDDVEIGEFYVVEEHDEFIKMIFSDVNKGLTGVWIIRSLSNGETLLWKPFPLVSTMPKVTKDLDTSLFIKQTQNFALFRLEHNGYDFTGTAVAEGVWTGIDKHTTLFTSEIVDQVYDKMKDTLDSQIVDYNHDSVNKGKLTDITLKSYMDRKYIEVKGISSSSVPLGSGLSVTLDSTIVWDNNLNVWVLVSAEPIGVSIITENTPACTICMIK